MHTPHPVRSVQGQARGLSLPALSALTLAATLALWLAQATPGLAQSQSTKPKVDESKTMLVLKTGAWNVYYANRRDAAEGILISNFEANSRKAQVGYALDPRSCTLSATLLVHGTELAGQTKLTDIEVSARVDEGPICRLTAELKRRQADGLFTLNSQGLPEFERLVTSLDPKAQTLRIQVRLPSGDVIYRFDLAKSKEAFDKARQTCEASMAQAKADRDAKKDADFFK